MVYQIAQSITKGNNLLEYVEAVTYGENLLNLYVKNGIIQWGRWMKLYIVHFSEYK